MVVQRPGRRRTSTASPPRSATGKTPPSATFGVRQIEWVENDDRDDVLAKSGHTARPWTMIGEPYPWVLRLNGRRVFLKGSNWVHADLLAPP